MSHLDKEYDLPLEHDLYLYRGDSFAQGVRLKDEATNTYFDLTGTTPVAQARETTFNDLPMFIFDIVIADQEDPDTLGLLYMQVPDSAWSNLPIFDEVTPFGVYDLEVLFPSGKKVTYLYGDIYIKGDTSR